MAPRRMSTIKMEFKRQRSQHNLFIVTYVRVAKQLFTKCLDFKHSTVQFHWIHQIIILTELKFDRKIGKNRDENGSDKKIDE